MNIKEALEEFNFFNEGDYITKNMSIAKDVVLTAYEKEKMKNKKLENELEKHIKFCEQEAKGSLHNEICHISLKFNKKLLNILKKEEQNNVK